MYADSVLAELDRRGAGDAVARVAAVFPARERGLSAWLVVPNGSLGGRTPAVALLDGDVELVVAVAEHHGT